MLAAPAYLLGAAALTAAVAAVWLGAATVRRRLIPGWSGPPAWTADAVLAAALFLWLAEALGAVGLLRGELYFPAAIAAGLALRLFAARRGTASGAPRHSPPAPSPGGAATLAAAAAAGLLAAHWSIGTQVAFEQGMRGYDTLWYHQPFAAEFLQSGSTWSLVFLDPRYLPWFYPASSELFHTIGMLAFQRDILSPLLNSLWLAGALLAAWSVGRPHRAGPLGVVAIALLFDAGVMADQAGSGRNDAIGIFFLLAAVAVLENARMAAPQRALPPGALAVAGLAAGLAAGVKLTFLLPALVLAAGIPLIAPRGRRRRAGLAFGLPLLAGCGYWYLRNLVHSGNPLPWVESLGPLPLPGPDQPLGGRPQASVLGYLDDPGVVGEWFLSGLHDSLGIAWPLVLALPLAAIPLALRARFDPLLRLIALAGLFAAAAWLLHGTSAEGPPGAPVGFVSGLRHLAPALALGLVLLPVLVAELAPRRAALAVLAGLLGLLVLVDASGMPWLSGQMPLAVVSGLVAATAVVVLSRPPLRTLSGFAAAALAGFLLVAAVLVLRPVSVSYIEQRYSDQGFSPAGLGAAYSWAKPLRDTAIATAASRIYPLYGDELSNRVRYLGAPRPRGGFVDLRGCGSWRRRLLQGEVEYVVIGDDRVDPRHPGAQRQLRWTLAGADTGLVLAVDGAAVIRLHGPPDPSACAAAPGR